MEYRTFGNTGIEVSVAGLGSGGINRLGLGNGVTEERAVEVVHRALDLGVNFFDTAAAYRTESLLGRALGSLRSEIVLCSKVGPRSSDGTLLDASGLRAAFEEALVRIGSDHLDVFMLHRVSAEDYDYCVEELYPELVALRDEGKLRAIGCTESTSLDVSHRAMQRAVRDRRWDVVMVAFNIFNQSARETVLPDAIDRGAAVVVMGAALSRRGPFALPEEITSEIHRLEQAGDLVPGTIDPECPFDDLVRRQLIKSSADAAYRLIAYEAGVNVVLIGTTNPLHLEENLRSIDEGPLPTAVREELVSTFGRFTIARA